VQPGVVTAVNVTSRGHLTILENSVLANRENLASLHSEIRMCLASMYLRAVSACVAIYTGTGDQCQQRIPIDQ